ncbi:hypothetical protein FRB97_007661 [Tulasnella sp. 331]|nr:hypothetical protein FRB97_007661 [Tulasnella sp. 331]
MPTGTPYSGHIPPYKHVRVDSFTNLGEDRNYRDDLLLLTHTHSDHKQGLLSKSMGLPFYCTGDAQTMLANYEPEGSRVRAFAFTRADIGRRNGGQPQQETPGTYKPALHRKDGPFLTISHQRTIEVNKPMKLDMNNREFVIVTAIDANHCPGSVMYLIEGDYGAVLHTGDVRCEEWWFHALKRNPFLRPYIPPSKGHNPPSLQNTSDIKGRGEDIGPIKQLEAIYLDTAYMFATFELPSKDDAVNGLIEMMGMYPSNTKFFINTWTPGYEEALIGIARSFGTKVHVDRYKYKLYSSLSEPIYKEILTTDPHATRFHACERFNRCDEVPFDAPDVVYVSPQDMPLTHWQKYQSDTMQALAHGNRPSYLNFALARHSSLPELKSLVGLFRPKRVVPCTLYPQLGGLDWLIMPVFFRDQMPHSAKPLMWKDMDENGVLCGVDRDAEVAPFITLEERQQLEYSGANGAHNVERHVETFLRQKGFKPFWEDGTVADNKDDPAETDFSVHLKNRLSGAGAINTKYVAPGITQQRQQPSMAIYDQELLMQRALLASFEKVAVSEGHADEDDASTDDEKGLMAESQEHRFRPSSSFGLSVEKNSRAAVQIAPSAAQTAEDSSSSPMALKRSSTHAFPPTPPSGPRPLQNYRPSLDAATQQIPCPSSDQTKDLRSTPVRTLAPTATNVLSHPPSTHWKRIDTEAPISGNPRSLENHFKTQNSISPQRSTPSVRSAPVIKLASTPAIPSRARIGSHLDYGPPRVGIHSLNADSVTSTSSNPIMARLKEAVANIGPAEDREDNPRPSKKLRLKSPESTFTPNRLVWNSLLPNTPLHTETALSSALPSSSAFLRPKPRVVNMRRMHERDSCESRPRTEPPTDPVALQDYRQLQKDQERRLKSELSRNMHVVRDPLPSLQTASGSSNQLSLPASSLSSISLSSSSATLDSRPILNPNGSLFLKERMERIRQKGGSNG